MIEESYTLISELQDALARLNFMCRMLEVQALPNIINIAFTRGEEKYGK